MRHSQIAFAALLLAISSNHCMAQEVRSLEGQWDEQALSSNLQEQLNKAETELQKLPEQVNKVVTEIQKSPESELPSEAKVQQQVTIMPEPEKKPVETKEDLAIKQQVADAFAQQLKEKQDEIVQRTLKQQEYVLRNLATSQDGNLRNVLNSQQDQPSSSVIVLPAEGQAGSAVKKDCVGYDCVINTQ